MDPILATGLVSLGKQIVTQIFHPNSATPAQNTTFDSALADAEKAQDAQTRELAQLRMRLASEPEFYQLTRIHGAEGIQLVQDADGQFALASANGERVPLPEGSSAAQHAARYAALANLAELPSTPPAEGPLSQANAVWKL